jgi:hypothetical protein
LKPTTVMSRDASPLHSITGRLMVGWASITACLIAGLR